MKNIDLAWEPGLKIESPVKKMTSIHPGDLDTKTLYKLMIGSIVPRPIALVSTISELGIGNLAPFSYFNGVCSNPPTLMISISHLPDGGKKDTLKNIEATGEFVVNSVNEWFIKPAAYTASAYPYGVDEMEKVGLTPLESEVVRPKRVKESAIQLECLVVDIIKVGSSKAGGSTLVLGEIKLAHIIAEAYQNGRVDFSKIRTVARLGGSYATISEEFTITPPLV